MLVMRHDDSPLLRPASEKVVKKSKLPWHEASRGLFVASCVNQVLPVFGEPQLLK